MLQTVLGAWDIAAGKDIGRGFPDGSDGKESACNAWIQSLGLKDPLEEGVATHSSILAWRIPWTEEPGGLQSMGSQSAGHNWATWVTNTHRQRIPTLMGKRDNKEEK